MISGVRGCGKTVFMTDISQEIGRDEDWIVVDLNPYKADLMQEAAAYLSSIQDLAQIFQKAKLNFSFIWIWSGSIRCGTDCGYSGRFGTDD